MSNFSKSRSVQTHLTMYLFACFCHLFITGRSLHQQVVFSVQQARGQKQHRLTQSVSLLNNLFTYKPAIILYCITILAGDAANHLRFSLCYQHIYSQFQHFVFTFTYVYFLFVTVWRIFFGPFYC